MKAKIADADIAMVLKEAHALVSQIPDLVRENQELREKVASYEQHSKAKRLVHKMGEKGLGGSLEGKTDEEKVATLLGSGRDIRVLEEAIDLVPMGGSPFELGSEERRVSGGSQSDLEKFVLGEID